MSRMDNAMRHALNAQVNMEMFASYQYLAMAAYFESINMRGFAQWMRSQAEEETVHAMKIFEFMLDRDETPNLQAIGEPNQTFESPLDAFEGALAHERKVTKSIYDLYELATEHRDYPAQMLLQWFITEQVEEESAVGAVVDRLKFAGDHPGALFMLDSEIMTQRDEDHDHGE